MGKIDSEKKVIQNMIRLYCRKKHKGEELCDECNILLNYATDRLTKCPFKDEKPACADCKVHCYKTEMREKIRRVMRFSGPRMIIYYPKDFFIHILKKSH
ncbi:MAG: nitrous oxide-stimulated promoter family protein [Paludibacter sp.]|nr:nitrous oxide-stimulated promoter family protein [Paludibacter sp.]